MDHQSSLTQIYQCVAQFPWIKDNIPTLNIKDLTAYGLGEMVTFRLDLDPNQDGVCWKEYNLKKPYIVVWLQEPDGDCPRFEAGYGPECFEMNDQDISRAIFRILESIRND